MKKIVAIFSYLLVSVFVQSQTYFDKLEKQERKENKIVYWEYGLPVFELSFAKQKVAKQYGFYFNHVAGCVVNDKIVARINKHNRNISALLTKKMGTDWKNIVYDAAYAVYKIDTTLINNFHIDAIFLDTLIKLLDTIKEPYEFRVNPTAAPNVFIIDAFFIDKDWNVSDRSLLKIEATYPDISYRIINTVRDNSITQVKKHKVDD
jgi:hypothetical protein